MLQRFCGIVLPLFVSLLLIGCSHSKKEQNNEVVVLWQPDIVVPGDLKPLDYMQYRLDSLLEKEPLIKKTHLGLMVYDLTLDTCVYEFNSQMSMRPGSNQKIITSITALDYLGPSYEFKTSLYYVGEIKNHTLTGDVICVGGMDPAFDSVDMAAFAQSLKDLGVNSIQGRLVADKSFKDGLMWGSAWQWDGYSQNPVLTALPYEYEDQFLSCFEQCLTDMGVRCNVTAVDDLLPAGARHLCTRTHSMDDILSWMLKNSDNMYAESLLYQMGAASGDGPSNLYNSREKVYNLIKKLGLDTKDYNIFDGCGLSVFDHVSAEMMVYMMRYAYHNPDIIDHLLPYLPIAGVDGTLEDRMLNSPAQGKVHAKTGTVFGVSCLSGYCFLPNGHALCFSIMNMGGGTNRVYSYRMLQDRICAAMCRP